MDKRFFKISTIILGTLILGSCARGIVVPPGLSSRLMDIKVNDTDTATIITLQTDNLPQYASFGTKSPPSIAIDLASTDASNVSKSISVDNGFVKKIAIEQLGESTGYSSRITITLNKVLPYQTTTNGNNIIVNVSKIEEQSAAPSLEGAQPTLTTQVEGLGISAPAVPEALAPVGMEASPTTTGIAPLAGGEVSAPVVPEALAPVGMEASPTAAVEQPTIPAPAGIIVPSASQGITEQVAQTNVAGEVSLTPSSSALAPASVSSAPKISQQPITQGSPIASVEKKHEEKIAMLTPIPSAAPEIKKIKIVHSVVITPIPLIFKNNEAVLPKDAEEGLKDVAEYMLKHKDLKLVIQGYSDAYGSEAYNKELSYYRALWVKMALERYGVPSNRLVMKPMGATKQFGHSKATYAQNRRVVLKIVK